MNNNFIYCKAYAYSTSLKAKLFLIINKQEKIIVCLFNKKTSTNIYVDGLDKILKKVFFFENFNECYSFISENPISTNSEHVKILLYPFDIIKSCYNNETLSLLDTIFFL